MAITSIVPAGDKEHPHDYDLCLGTDTHTREQVWVSQKKLREGIITVGATGSGKSILLSNMAIQSLRQGIGICVIAPEPGLINRILAQVPRDRINDVILLEPLDSEYAFGMNSYHPISHTPEHIQDSINQTLQVYEKVFHVDRDNPLVMQVLRHTAFAMLENGMTMAEIPAMLLDKNFRDRMMLNITNPQTRFFWQMYDGLKSDERMAWAAIAFRKVDEFLSNYFIRTIVGQTKTTINFREIMDTGKILLVKLPGKDEDMTSLLGATIIGQLFIAALSREDIPDERNRKYFNIYIDEYRRFQTESMNKLLTETRKYGISNCIALQATTQIDEQALGDALQAGTKIFFYVNVDDAKKVAGEFDTTPAPAVKPEPTIPKNVLDYLPKHQSEIAKAFWGKYVTRLEASLHKRERQDRDIGTVYPEHDFGEGFISYNPTIAYEAYEALNGLFYEAQTTGQVNETEKNRLLGYMSQLLGFSLYWSGKEFDPKTVYISSVLMDKIKEQTKEVNQRAKLCERLKGDDSIIPIIYANLEDPQKVFESQVAMYAERTARCPSPEGYYAWIKSECAKAVEEWEEAHKNIPPPSRFTSLLRGKKSRYDNFGNKTRYDVYDYDFECGEYYAIWVKSVLQYRWQIQDIRTALQSDEAFMAFLPRDQRFERYTTKEALWKRFTEIYNGLEYERKHDTIEKWLAYDRSEAQWRLESAQKILKELQDRVDRQIADEKASYNTEVAIGKQHHDRFVAALTTVLALLMTDKGKIKVYSTEWEEKFATQQTHSDREGQISNILTHLGNGEALVKLPDRTEHRIKTEGPKNVHNLEAITKRVRENTRNQYTQLRIDVEREMAERIKPDEPPTTTKRRGTV